MIKVRTIEGMTGNIQEFWVKNPKKIEFYKKMNEYNPHHVMILKIKR